MKDRKKRSGSYEGGKGRGNERPGAILRVTSSTYFRVNDNYYATLGGDNSVDNYIILTIGTCSSFFLRKWWRIIDIATGN